MSFFHKIYSEVAFIIGGEDNTIKLMEKKVEISPSMPLLELTYEEDGVVRHPICWIFCLTRINLTTNQDH